MKALNGHFTTVGSNLAKKMVSKPGDNCLQNIKQEQTVMKSKIAYSQSPKKVKPSSGCQLYRLSPPQFKKSK